MGWSFKWGILACCLFASPSFSATSACENTFAQLTQKASRLLAVRHRNVPPPASDQNEVLVSRYGKYLLPWANVGVGGYLAAIAARSFGIQNGFTQHWSNFGLGFAAAATVENALLRTRLGARYPRLVRTATLGAMVVGNFYWETYATLRPDYADLTTGLLAVPVYHLIANHYFDKAERDVREQGDARQLVSP